jgi:hypothetical protein
MVPFNFAYVSLIRGFAADEKFKLFMAAISSVYRRPRAQCFAATANFMAFGGHKSNIEFT